MRYLGCTCILFILLLSACQPTRSPKRYLIGFSQCSTNPWREVMDNEMRRELSFHPEVDLAIRNAKEDSELQIEQIKELISLDIDLLIVAPNESEPLTLIIDEVYRSGLPVLLIDRKTNSDQFTAYIGADNYEIGHTAGKYIARRLNAQGKILELMMAPSISPTKERSQGILDAIAMYPDLEVVDSISMGFSIDNINQNFPGLLKAHPEANVVFAQTDGMGKTAYQIARNIGRADSIFWVGVDAIPGRDHGIQAVEDGILDATLMYPTGGAEAIRLALTILSNLPFERMNLLQTTVIDPDNAAILHAQMKKEINLQQGIDKQIARISELDDIFRNQRIFILTLASTLLLAIVLGIFLWRSLHSKQRINYTLRQRNDEVLAQQAKIVEMSDEIQRVSQAKVEFFTNISHEFRTPLTLILGFAKEILPFSGLDKEVKQHVQLIRQNAYRLFRLVNQLMDFRKVEENKVQLNVSENDLVAFVQNAMNSYVQIAEKRNISFELLTNHPELLVWYDPNMLDKVIFNLLSNAFKFTDDGKHIHVLIQQNPQSQTVDLIVEDGGKGIQSDELEKIFEPFYRVENEKIIGTGLGLPFSRKLINAHKGSLEASSQKGTGTRFTVTLPLGKDHFALSDFDTNQGSSDPGEYPTLFVESELDLPSYESESVNEEKQNRVLIIEDNADLQFFLRKTLGQLFHIRSAQDGLEGLELALDEIPDLIISDIQLPGLDGLTITQRLKEDIRTSHIPVLLLTSRGTLDQQIEGIKTGADAYVPKPFDIQYLKAQILNLLQNRSLLKESYRNNLVQMAIEKRLSPLDQKFLQKLHDYVAHNYERQDFAVSDLCEEMGLSRSQLYRKVKALLGQSITDYILEIRLKKAEVLLHKKELSIADIAYQIGYSSPDYFATVFKNRYNLTPSQFRKQGFPDSSTPQ